MLFPIGVLVLSTSRNEFKTYDYANFYSKMMRPAFLFDGRNLLQHSAMEAIGFEVYTLGKANVPSHAQPTGIRKLDASEKL